MMMMVMMMMMIIITVIVTAFKGAIRDFYNLLTAPRTVSNTYAQVARAQSCAESGATHRAFITCNMSSYLPRGTNGQLSY